MNTEIKDPSNLAESAAKTDAEEFFHLIETFRRFSADEERQVRNWQMIGRLAEVSARHETIIVGDVHGDLESLTHILKDSAFLAKAESGEGVLLIFLGDYGDRGVHSPEVYYVVLKLKELFPNHVVLMRGNHEGPDDLLAYPHDLPSHLHRKFGKDSSRIYEKIRGLFDLLYNGVVIEDRCILLHGGAPSQAATLNDVAYAHEKHPQEPHLEEILWSDPVDGLKGAYRSPRGAGKHFGEDITDKILSIFNVNALIRGHESSTKGYKTNHHGKVLTLFSRKGPPYFNEQGAYLRVDSFEEVRDANQLLKHIRKF